MLYFLRQELSGSFAESHPLWLPTSTISDKSSDDSPDTIFFGILFVWLRLPVTLSSLASSYPGEGSISFVNKALSGAAFVINLRSVTFSIKRRYLCLRACLFHGRR
jgi:hypothetical protein